MRANDHVPPPDPGYERDNNTTDKIGDRHFLHNGSQEAAVADDPVVATDEHAGDQKVVDVPPSADENGKYEHDRAMPQPQSPHCFVSTPPAAQQQKYNDHKCDREKEGLGQ
jgi:hypothetical protein